MFRKELADHFRSKRFVIIMLIVAVTCLAAVYSAGMGIRQAVASQNGEFVFSQVVYQQRGFPPLLPPSSPFRPLGGLSLVLMPSTENETAGTLSRLLAQPIYRDGHQCQILGGSVYSVADGFNFRLAVADLV